MEHFEIHTGVPRINKYFLNRSYSGEHISGLLAFNNVQIPITSPKISLWEFSNRDELQKFLNLEEKSAIKTFISDLNTNNFILFSTKIQSFIDNQMPEAEVHNEVLKSVYVEMIYNVRKFCKNGCFNLEQSGAILSQFHLTHLYMKSDSQIPAEKVYLYFKELMLCHSLPFPPKYTKIFSIKESKQIMELFGKIYLRYLPLIRFLSLPNYALQLNYPLEPDPKLQKKDKKRDKSKNKKNTKKKK